MDDGGCTGLLILLGLKNRVGMDSLAVKAVYSRFFGCMAV